MARTGGKSINRKKRGKAQQSRYYTNGELSRAEKRKRAKERAKAEQNAKEANVNFIVEQRRKHLGLSERDARSQHADMVSYRWLQSKQIQPAHHEASVRFAELWFSYLRAIDDENSRLKRSQAGYVDPEEQAYIERCKRVRSEFETIRAALISHDNQQRTNWWRAAVTISIENKQVDDLQGEFREAMNTVHRLLIAAERKAA